MSLFSVNNQVSEFRTVTNYNLSSYLRIDRAQISQIYVVFSVHVSTYYQFTITLSSQCSLLTIKI